jgi:glycosidase
MADGQFDFPLRALLISNVLMRQGGMQDVANFMDSNTGFYGSSVMSTFLGNHDVPRSIHFAQDAPLWGNAWDPGKDRSWQNQPGVVGEDSAYERIATAMAILMTNRGAPLIYYGDEIGLPGGGDPDNRRFMQWSGYTAAQSTLLDRVQKLGTARAAHSALRRGDRTTISVDQDTWTYRMVDGQDVVYVAINRGDTAHTIGNLPAKTFSEVLTGQSVSGPTITVPPRSARVLE